MTAELLTNFFTDRLNVLTMALLVLLAFGAYIAFFTKLKEEPKKKKA